MSIEYNTKVGKRWLADQVGVTDRATWPKTKSNAVGLHNFVDGKCVNFGAKQSASSGGPTAVTITNSLETLGVGERYKLTAGLDRNEEHARSNGRKSSSAKVATVKGGVVTADAVNSVY